MNDRRVVIERAEREGIKARIALVSPTGFGKTWTALSLATEMQGVLPILGIDTERRSMGLYGHVKDCPPGCTHPKHFTFQWLPWDPPYDPAELTAFLEAESHRYGVIIIDSLSHFWKGEGGTIDAVDNIARRQASGGRPDSFAAWKEGGTIQDKLIGAILGARCHVICCFRVKMTYERQESEQGGRKQTKIVKLGLSPIQRDDVEYEFTVIGEMDQEHHLVITKTRCDELDRQVYAAGEQRKMAAVLMEWLGESRDGPIDRLAVPLPEARARVMYVLEKLDKQRLRSVVGDAGYPGPPLALSAWLEGSRDAVVKLVGMLRLPLDIEAEVPREPEPEPAPAPEPEPERVEVDKVEQGGEHAAGNGTAAERPLTGTEAVVRALDSTCESCGHLDRWHGRDGCNQCECPDTMAELAKQPRAAKPKAVAGGLPF